MKNEKITWGLALGSILLQWYFMYASDIFERELPASTGLLVADTSGGNMTMVLYSIIPIPFLLWLFSGKMESIVRGYGKLYIIRDYSRRKMLLREVGKMMLTVIFIQCFAWVVFQVPSNNNWMPLTTTEQIRVMTLYMLVLMATALLQYCLELIINQVYAQITTLVYYTVSLFIYSSAQDTGVLMVMRGVFFPNLGFGMRNGAVESGGTELFLCSVIEILLICCLLIYISLKILDKKDIM